MMTMNCFCGMADRRKALILISSRDHRQSFWPSLISDMPRAGFEPAQNQNFRLCWRKLCSSNNHYTTAKNIRSLNRKKSAISSCIPVSILIDSMDIYLPLLTDGTKYWRMDQIKFVEDSLLKSWRDMVCLSRPYPRKFFKGCLPQILLDPFLNTMAQILSMIPWKEA